MTCGTYPNLLALADEAGSLLGPQGKLVRTMLGLSVAVHVGVLVMATSLRLAPSFERPLASYQVSLVDLASPSHPAPRVSREAPAHPVSLPAPTIPPKTAAPPAPDRLPDLPRDHRAERTEMVPPQNSSPLPLDPLPPPAPAREPRSPLKLREALRGIELPPEVPRVTPAPVKPVPTDRSNDRLRQALQGIELPPEAPSFEEVRRETVPVSPKAAPAKPQTNVQALLSQLKVPEAPAVPAPTPESVRPAPDSPSRSSLSEDLAKQLARLPAAAKQPSPETQARVASKAAGPVKPGARIQVAGLAPGFSQYLARIQNEISKKWIAPQVEAPEGVIQVVIKFRLHRGGSVSHVEIEQTSGNEYYDLAGKRAVLSAHPLPPFPNELSHAFFDAHFSFTVGGETG